MPILARYISREFFKTLLISLGAFVAIYLVVDIFQGMRMFMDFKPPFHIIAKLYLLKIPKIVSQVTPIAVLLSTLLTLGLLSKSSEITAMKSSGISLYLIVSPILVIGVMISAFSFLFSEYLVPYTNKEVRFTERVTVRKETPKSFFKQNKIWYRSDNAIYNIQLFEPDHDTFKGITIYYMGANFKLTKRIDAREARWDGTTWRFYDAKEETFTNGQIPVRIYKEIPIKLPESPEDFKIEKRETEDMGFAELREYIKKLRKEGYDSTTLSADLYSKISFPFTSLIMVFIGIPFALKGGRSSGVAFGVGISVLVGFGYWLIMSLGLSLGRVEALPPLLAAWGANIVFGLAGILMMMKVEGD